MKLNPYINFEGNAEESLNFYKAVLGGEIESLSRYADSPMPSDDDWKQKILHARFVFDGNLLMISDGFKGYKPSDKGGIQLSVEADSLEQLETLFSKMSEGGKVVYPLENMFWGARFGMLQDKFGINWMFNFDLKK